MFAYVLVRKNFVTADFFAVTCEDGGPWFGDLRRTPFFSRNEIRSVAP
jgi:hypothetical protein